MFLTRRGEVAGVITDILDKLRRGEAPGSSEQAQGGLGIGLMLVRSLVDLHGGSIIALSDGPGRGSEFVIRLPLE